MSKHHKDSSNGHSGNPHDGHSSGGHASDEHRHGGPEENRQGSAPDATGAAAGPSSDVDALKAALADKEKELAEFKDKYLRSLADAENARKRIRQQSEESVRIQRENLIRDILPIVDNLERAVDAARQGASDGNAIVAGVEMVLRAMMDLLRAQGVMPIASVGQPFDPARHEAVDHVPSDKHAPNTVIDEFHRGYQIGERILRPARVSVSKQPNGTTRNNGENEASDVEND